MKDKHALELEHADRIDRLAACSGIKTTTKHDPIERPSHYNEGSIECIDAIQANLTKEEFIGYLRGNIKKYEWRCRYKGKMEEDLKKAGWYLNKLIEVLTHE